MPCTDTMGLVRPPPPPRPRVGLLLEYPPARHLNALLSALMPSPHMHMNCLAGLLGVLPTTIWPASAAHGALLDA